MFMNERFNKTYDISQILEAIDNVILDIYKRQYWGYNLFFYIAASAKCHPNYVSFLMNKKTLSVKQILEILGNLKFEKKLLYDAKYAEQVYLEYQNVYCDDKGELVELKNIFKNKKVLLIGPGNNIKRETKKVENFIQEESPIIVSINYVPKNIKVDYVFLTKTKRYTQLLNDMLNSLNNKEVKIIATSNVTKAQGKFSYVLNYGSLIDYNTEIIDNSLIMFLKATKKLEINNIYLAGFDGYSKRADNYFDISKEYSFAKEKADYLNSYVKNYLKNNSVDFNIEFITKSRYDK